MLIDRKNKAFLQHDIANPWRLIPLVVIVLFIVEICDTNAKVLDVYIFINKL